MHLSMHAMFANSDRVLGTALGEKHVPLIRRFTDSITLVLDGDAAGQNRTLDILDNLLALFVAHEVELKILSLPEGADPCDVIRSHGSDEFRRLLTQSVDALEHKINAVTKGLAPGAAPHQAAQAVEAILATLAKMLPAGASASSTAPARSTTRGASGRCWCSCSGTASSSSSASTRPSRNRSTRSMREVRR